MSFSYCFSPARMVARIRDGVRDFFGFLLLHPALKPDASISIPVPVSGPSPPPSPSPAALKKLNLRKWLWVRKTEWPVLARTKSEDRAMFKQQYKLKRLPIGAKVVLAPGESAKRRNAG